MSMAFRRIVQEGRVEDIELVTATNTPENYHPAITGAASELVCFRTIGPKALDKLAELGADADEVAALPLGSFVSYDRLTGGARRGKLF